MEPYCVLDLNRLFGVEFEECYGAWFANITHHGFRIQVWPGPTGYDVNLDWNGHPVISIRNKDPVKAAETLHSFLVQRIRALLDVERCLENALTSYRIQPEG